MAGGFRRVPMPAWLRRSPVILTWAGRWWHRRGPETASRTAAVAGLSALLVAPVLLALVVWSYLQPAQTVQVDSPYLVGSEVRDGPVTFVVHLVRCGETPEAVHGQRCEVVVGARNHGSHPVTIPALAQTLLADTGAQHRPAVGEQPKPFGTLAPGEAAAAELTFDLPATSQVTAVRVHAGPYTEGQAVKVDHPLPLAGK